MTLRHLAVAALLVGCTRSSHPPTVVAAPTHVTAREVAAVPASVPVVPEPARPACRADLPPAPALRLEGPAQRMPASGADPSPALAAVCRRLAASTAALMQRATRGLDTTGFQSAEDIGVCLPAGRGAWAFELASLVPRRERGTSALLGSWRLVYFDTTGRRLTSVVGGPMRLLTQGSQRPTKSWIVDLDRDGVGEIHSALVTDWIEERSVEAPGVMQVHGGAVRVFEPLQRVESASIVDADGDGTADFLVAPPYAVPNAGLSESMLTAFSVLLHGRPDLTWSNDDAVAQEYVRQRCAGVAGPPYYRAPTTEENASLDDAAARLTCARYRGVPLAEIERALRAELSAGERPAAEIEVFTGTLAQTLDLLRPEPPVVVEPRCPAAR